MIKFKTIGAFSSVVTFPHLSADTDIENYSVVAMNQGTKKAAYAAATTAGRDLAIVMNDLYNRTGDLYADDGKVIKAGKKLLLVGLESLATRELDIDATHIKNGLDANGSLTVAIDAVLVPDANTGKLVVGTAPTAAGSVYLKVTGLTTLIGKAVTAQIIRV